MRKQALTLGIILSLGTAGCAGFGVQQGSSLSSQLQKQQGIDALWSATEAAPTQGLEPPRYADQSLGDLWDVGVEGPEAVRGDDSRQNRNKGDLWNPASVTRSWEIDGGSKSSPSRGLLFGASSGSGTRY